MAEVSIKKVTDFPNAIFEVTLSDGVKTTHQVTLRQDYYQKLTALKITPEALIEKSFRFLLEREPNTSILPEFELSLIQRYFPEYEQEAFQS